ncbi:hypothetical protein [Micromonospora avicenniae]|uniref:DUF1508 domain-containing protein n=1 Tax=Micromonospora avicenniae TaxID=1198245 RepID=A0A1N7FKI4_9ACTN|nr:hypothetical protein [Micromonospora avicenniae]SIS00746.1 hypothetical protein SAMN05444858_1399 [Micromonospora avicenniae]
MNSYFFEIIERASDRYSWILVLHREGRRQVIARAYRDYRSPRKAARAAEALQKAVGGAEIVYAYPPTPDYSFQILRDVLPLPVGSAKSAEGHLSQSPQSSITQSPAISQRSATSRAARMDDGAPTRFGVGEGKHAPAPAGAPARPEAGEREAAASVGAPARPEAGEGETAPTRIDDAAPAAGAVLAKEPAKDKAARPRKQQTSPAPRGRGAARATTQS